MRYYVISDSESEGIEPHIVAEVVRDRTDPSRRGTLAAALADEHRLIVNREELLAHPVGAKALAAWEAKDDTVYDNETDEVRAEACRHHPARRILKLVRD